MMRASLTVALSALVLAANSSPARSEAESGAADVDAAVAAFYRPYRQALALRDPAADWDRPIFSADLRSLIGRWKTGFRDDEVAELQNFGWLCECQEWDEDAFDVTVRAHPVADGDRLVAEVRIEIGWNETRDARLLLVREAGEWLIDDIESEAFPGGLRASLMDAIEHNAAGAS